MKKEDYLPVIKAAFKEDAVLKDATSNNLIDKLHRSTVQIKLKDSGVVLCGLTLAKAIFRQLDSKAKFSSKFKDGDLVKKPSVIAEIIGNTRLLLAAERVALNFLSYLSAIATQTNQYVKKVSKTKVKILDTRKTTPMLRKLERYAVKTGGGVNHRFNLEDMVMIKDNHRVVCAKDETLAQTIKRIRRKTNKKIEVEVDSILELKDALNANPDIILLDNMGPTLLRKAVALVRKQPVTKQPLLEASGGITLKNVEAIAKTGVDRISIGALTHSRKAIDFSLELKI